MTQTRRAQALPQTRPDSPDGAGAGHSGQRQPQPPARGEGPAGRTEQSCERVSEIPRVAAWTELQRRGKWIPSSPSSARTFVQLV